MSSIKSKEQVLSGLIDCLSIDTINLVGSKNLFANIADPFPIGGPWSVDYFGAQAATTLPGLALVATPVTSSLANVVESVDALVTNRTTYVLTVGQTAQGVVSSGADHDWYRVSLTRGQTYTFAEIGTGTNALKDPFLNIRDANGRLVASNDDGGPGASSLLTYRAAATANYYIDAGSFNNASTGQYGISVTLGNKASFDVSMGGGALNSYNTWSPAGSPATISYGFRESAPTYNVPGSNIASFSQLSIAQMDAVQSILRLWSDVAGVRFTQISNSGQPYDYTNNATILIANYTDPNDGAGAFAFYPGSTASAASNGDLWLNLSSVSSSSLPLGSYGYFAIMHELGHALGLAHPGDYNAAPGVSITYANNAQFTQDSEQYSVMSYFAGSATGQTPGNFASAYTPMLLDIYELQMLYGVNTSTHLGDTVYGFNSTAGINYDFAGIASPQFCIWDAGGAQDVLDCSGYSGAQNISLAPGTFSSVDGAVNNVSIAIGCIIEKAIGGSGADTFVGGKGANTLVGNAGADIFAYLAAADSTTAARDVINDFVKGQDKIDLSGIDARTATAAVNDAFSATLLASSGNFTAAGQLRYFLSNGQTIVEGNTDTVFSTAEFSIALIGNYTIGPTQLAASDFVL